MVYTGEFIYELLLGGGGGPCTMERVDGTYIFPSLAILQNFGDIASLSSLLIPELDSKVIHYASGIEHYEIIEKNNE